MINMLPFGCMHRRLKTTFLIAYNNIILSPNVVLASKNIDKILDNLISPW